MMERMSLIGLAVSEFTLGVVALGLMVDAVLRRRWAGQKQAWVRVIFQGVLVVVLFALGAASLRGAALADAGNRSAPTPSGAVVAFVPNTRIGASTMIQAVSARDGTTRWTRSLRYNISSLVRATPDIILAETYFYGVCALRTRDGVVLWCFKAEFFSGGTGLMATDGARVYVVNGAPAPQGTGTEVVALNVQTGTVVWRAPLGMTQAQMVVCGDDGLVLLAAGGATAGQWEIIALGARDGKERWVKTVVASTVVGGADTHLLVAGGNVILQTGAGPLTALREQDGTTAWSEPSPPTGATAATMLNEATSDGTVVYVMSYISAYALNSANGIEVNSAGTRLMALEARTGAVQWSRAVHPYDDLGLNNDTFPGVLRLSDGVLLNGINFDEAGFRGFDQNGSLLSAYDTEDGQLLWRDNRPPTGTSWDLSDEMTPLGGDGVVYLVGLQSPFYIHDQQVTCLIVCPGVTWLYAVNVQTGVPWWRIHTGYFNLGKATL